MAEPMSDARLAEIREVVARARADELARRQMVLELLEEVDHLREVLWRVGAAAGHPDPAEGCRIVIEFTRAALAGEEAP